MGKPGLVNWEWKTTPEKTGKFVEWTLHTNITTTDSIIIQKAKEARGKERKESRIGIRGFRNRCSDQVKCISSSPGLGEIVENLSSSQQFFDPAFLSRRV